MSDGEDDHEISYIEETGQVKFYLRRPVHLYAPTAIKEGGYDPLLETTPPAQSLQLQWVHGYRGRDNRNNMAKLASGEVVYVTAAVAVIYNVEENAQRFYAQHTDDIKSIALHPDGETVATGQVKGVDDEFDAAHIRVWNSSTLETLHVFGMNEVHRAVMCLAFSVADGGAQLAVVDNAPEPFLSVWDWADESKVASVKCPGDQVLAVNWSREDTPRVLTSGKGGIIFWTINGDTLKKRTGVFGDVPKPSYITAVAFNAAGQTVTGDSAGNVNIWRKDGNEIDKSVPDAHSGSIFFICTAEDGGFFTCGKDRFIKHWDAEFQSSDASAELSTEIGAARAVTEAGGQVVVGSISNMLAKGTMEEGFTVITQGSEDEQWGVETHPSEGKYLTGSLDGTVAERDVESRQLLWAGNFDAGGVLSVCYSPGGEVIVVSFTAEKWLVLDAATKEELYSGGDGDEAIQMVRFSPDGSLLALGSRDNKVYLYEVSDEYKAYTQRGVCSGHSSYIRSFDFSADGATLRTNSGDYELLFWRTEDCSQIPGSEDLRDTEWATRSCLLCFENFGVWPEGVDGTDLNAVAAAHSKDLVVTADDFGKIKLFNSKTYYAYTANKVYQGHSSHVTNVAFTHDDSTVISVGGNDCSVFQWTVVDAK